MRASIMLVAVLLAFGCTKKKEEAKPPKEPATMAKPPTEPNIQSEEVTYPFSVASPASYVTSSL